MKNVYLICGVPGSGKTWVARQLEDKFNYIPNDDFIGKDYIQELFRAARNSDKPVLADCPFGERLVRDELERRGTPVVPVFIVENAQLIKKRYEARDKKPIPSAHITRAINLSKRAEEWRAFYGTSQEVLEHLRALA